MVNLYAKLPCYLCDGVMLGRNIGSVFGSGKFTHYICVKCTKENYVWATADELVTDFEKTQKKEERAINKIMLELGGIISV